MELQPLRVPIATRAAPLLRQEQNTARRHGVHSRSDSEAEAGDEAEGPTGEPRPALVERADTRGLERELGALKE